MVVFASCTSAALDPTARSAWRLRPTRLIPGEDPARLSEEAPDKWHRDNDAPARRAPPEARGGPL